MGAAAGAGADAGPRSNDAGPLSPASRHTTMSGTSTHGLATQKKNSVQFFITSARTAGDGFEQTTAAENIKMMGEVSNETQHAVLRERMDDSIVQ
jgi:hypothetical protein